LDTVEISTVVLFVFVGWVGLGWLRVYCGLDLLLSKLSIAQSSGKFRERHKN